jgi:hypothetical protein
MISDIVKSTNEDTIAIKKSDLEVMSDVGAREVVKLKIDSVFLQQVPINRLLSLGVPTNPI